MTSPLPPNESGRLEALRRYKILDTASEQTFDEITALAAHISGDYPQVRAAVALLPAPAVQLRANFDLWVITSHICIVPMAIIGLVDSDRVWYKSKVGLTTTQVAV